MNKKIERIKFSSPLTIQYILISNSHNYSANEFYVNSFNLLRTLPIELNQLENSVQHFDFCFKYKTVKSYELFTLPGEFFNFEKKIVIENLKNYSNSFNVQSLIKVFLIDESSKNHTAIAAVLKNINFCYYIIIGDKNHASDKYWVKNFFTDTRHFIEIIKRDLKSIEGGLREYYKKKNESIDIDLKLAINPSKQFIDQNKIAGSILTWNNYFILNQVIGNIWAGINDELGEVQTPPEKRSEELIEQCEKIDSLSSIMYNHVGVKTTDPFQPIYPSLVIILPYHYPKKEILLEKTFSKKQKKWLSIQNSEQNLQYQHLIPEYDDNEVPMESIRFIMRFNALRLMYLDNAAFIHSMFTYSPTIRLPQIGKSINQELSHLEKVTRNKQSTISNIEKFGKKLKQLTLTDNVNDYIKNRNGQIFAISDLPIEWLYLDDYPLCFTHDVCRLPEFNLNSIINNAIHLQRNLYQIPEDLINKTLVIHCASENDAILNSTFNLIDDYKEKLGFKSLRCKTVEEISQAIQKYNPELLIFDCHGSSDKKELSSFLIVDGEKKIVLTGEDIVKFKISAPLVFLSACETFPNYGYVKLLSDAFMEAGAYTVTTTFFSIKVVDAVKVIIRLLNNLYQLKINSYHINWLNFISHILRTSLIYETVHKSRKHFKKEITNDEIATIMTKSMKFEYRLEALNDLNNLIKEKSTKQVTFKELDNEWLSYSIIGRADLIYFEKWLKEYRDKNLWK